MSLVVNPVAATPEMNRWGRELTAAATNDLRRARTLYDLMATRVAMKPVHGRQYRTAQEVFAAWDMPGESFLCQELTYVYVALARAVHLKAYTVFVEQDCYGAWNYHACAAVFIGGKAFLVDPAYSRFGVPHKRFTVLDDLQAAGVFLSGMVDCPAACQIACKLAPTLAVVQASLFDKLAGERRWVEAGERLRLMRRLEPRGPMTYYAQAVLAFQEAKFTRAERFLARAIHLAPRMPKLHAMLGYLNAARGNLVEAKRCYEKAYDCCQDERSARMTQQTIAEIDARLNRPAAER
ncbi:MAG TPA: transglutaminase domain-containing protein [Verrucomicrobiota bacterium]|nr:transglutaminase domain-containing protein [Verrucomicrobiota bacterium]